MSASRRSHRSLSQSQIPIMIMLYAAVAFAFSTVAYFRLDPTKNGSAELAASVLQIPIFFHAAQAYTRQRSTSSKAESTEPQRV